MEQEAVKILCVDDEKNVLRSLERLFMDEEYEILTATTGEEGLAVLAETSDIQLVVSDYRMPGMDGVDFLKQVNERWPATIRIVLSGFADTASVVGAINEGQIYKFIPKPWNDEELKVTIAKALEVYFLRQKNERLADELMEAYLELETINANLEEEVRSRTEAMTFQNSVLQFTNQVMDGLPTAIIGLDLSGLVVLANRQANLLLAGDRPTLVGMDAEQVLVPEVLQLVAGVDSDAGQRALLVVAGDTYRVMVSKLTTNRQQEGVIVMFVPE